MKVIEVSASKGGVGTTTTACAIALTAQSRGMNTLLLALSNIDDVLSILGTGAASPESDEPIEVSLDWAVDDSLDTLAIAQLAAKRQGARIDLSMYGDKYDLIVIDAGRGGFRKYGLGSDENGRPWNAMPTCVRVVRNCYVSARNEVNATRKRSPKTAIKYVCYVESGRPLTGMDVQAVLSGISTDITCCDLSSEVARKIDAGLFARTMNTDLDGFIRTLVK